MNMDFHYYGTYAAAKITGYSDEDAETIAYAAQFVDDCTKELLSEVKKKTKTETIETCEEVKTIVKDAANFLEPVKKDDVIRERKIWSAFHFLPGNFNGEVKYWGKLPPEKTEEKVVVAQLCRDNFKLMCLPNSELSNKMVEKLCASTYEGNKKLIQIGMIMHVLADTWSHMFFAGVPEYCANDVKMTYTDSAKSGIPVASVHWQSPVYLGHGQITHSPDIPNLHFSYYPVWLTMVREPYSIGVKIDGVDVGNGKIVRDNPTIFAKAFQSMITVLSKIQNKEAVQVGIQEDIRGMLSIGEEEQSKEWSAYIQKILNTQNVPVYNKMTWVDEHNKSGNQDSKFETFMEVAIEHQTFVEDFIKEKTGIGN